MSEKTPTRDDAATRRRRIEPWANPRHTQVLRTEIATLRADDHALTCTTHAIVAALNTDAAETLARIKTERGDAR